MTGATTRSWRSPTPRSVAARRSGPIIPRPRDPERLMPKRGYHHGNLRQALVDAALILIETKGPTGFTLSEAAKSAGVTPAAVYRHFEGRDDLIAEAARQGYEIFGDAMRAAFDA